MPSARRVTGRRPLVCSDRRAGHIPWFGVRLGTECKASGRAYIVIPAQAGIQCGIVWAAAPNRSPGSRSFATATSFLVGGVFEILAVGPAAAKLKTANSGEHRGVLATATSPFGSSASPAAALRREFGNPDRSTERKDFPGSSPRPPARKVSLARPFCDRETTGGASNWGARRSTRQIATYAGHRRRRGLLAAPASPQAAKPTKRPRADAAAPAATRSAPLRLEPATLAPALPQRRRRYRSDPPRQTTQCPCGRGPGRY